MLLEEFCKLANILTNCAAELSKLIRIEMFRLFHIAAGVTVDFRVQCSLGLLNWLCIASDANGERPSVFS